MNLAIPQSKINSPNLYLKTSQKAAFHTFQHGLNQSHALKFAATNKPVHPTTGRHAKFPAWMVKLMLALGIGISVGGGVAISTPAAQAAPLVAQQGSPDACIDPTTTPVINVPANAAPGSIKDLPALTTRTGGQNQTILDLCGQNALLSDSSRAMLEAQLQKWNFGGSTFGDQMLVVIVPKVGSGTTLENIAKYEGNTVQVGDKNYNNGLVVVVDASAVKAGKFDQSAITFLADKGIRSDYPAATIQDILQKNAFPSLQAALTAPADQKQSYYDQAVQNTVNALIKIQNQHDAVTLHNDEVIGEIVLGVVAALVLLIILSNIGTGLYSLSQGNSFIEGLWLGQILSNMSNNSNSGGSGGGSGWGSGIGGGWGGSTGF